MPSNIHSHESREEYPPTLRYDVTPSDRDVIKRIVEGTGFFRTDEISVAVELIDERLKKGDASGYYFILAEMVGIVTGYACYGPIACTLGSYDLHWIAVDPAYQRRSLGRILLREVERHVLQNGGRHIYIETSGRPQYIPTRSFYQQCGYQIAAVLPDFYDRNDDKVVWRKIL